MNTLQQDLTSLPLEAREQLEYAALRANGLLYLLSAMVVRDGSRYAPPTHHESEGIVILASDVSCSLSRATGMDSNHKEADS